MWLDLGALVLIVGFAVLGFFMGIIVQIFRLIGMVAIFFYIYFVAEPVGEWLAVHMQMGSIAAYYTALIGGALVIYAIFALLGRSISNMVSKGGEAPQTLDRVLGFGLGVVKGLVVAFLVLCMFDMVPSGKFGGSPWVTAQKRESSLIPRVHPWNPLPELSFLQYAEEYKKIADEYYRGDPTALNLLLIQPPAKALRANPKFEVAAHDPELQRLIEKKLWPDVLVNDKILALVFDRNVRTLLNQLRPDQALKDAAISRAGAGK
jgi:membrane protein required for colicin V production